MVLAVMSSENALYTLEALHVYTHRTICEPQDFQWCVFSYLTQTCVVCATSVVAALEIDITQAVQSSSSSSFMHMFLWFHMHA